jgi:hypothetical protein
MWAAADLKHELIIACLIQISEDLAQLPSTYVSPGYSVTDSTKRQWKMLFTIL